MVSISLIRVLLFYVIPLNVLICICMGCAIWRECRRTRAGLRNRRNIPIQSIVVNPVEQSSRRNSFSPPPPYTTESVSNLDESLPSYEHAINRHS